MLTIRKKLFKSRKGFTLIELIVVIAILAILAIIAIPRFLGTLNNARATADDATAKVIESAVQLYYAELGVMPDGLGDLDPDYLDESKMYWSNNTAVGITSIDNDTGVVVYTNKP